ncbi:hypothetical protein C8R43DRAFT_1035759 [Mycena crocata]|nr:hypothetical protein C8R43DRAFT_1035759 [Mycena crocata]
MSNSYRLRLGQSTLVFFPSQSFAGGALHESHVVQVMVKTESTSPTREEVAAYYDAQEEITNAVETLLLKNLIIPFQKTVEIKGDGYILTGEQKEWVYGRGLEPKWGDEEVRVGADKWVFYFRMN